MKRKTGIKMAQEMPFVTMPYPILAQTKSYVTSFIHHKLGIKEAIPDIPEEQENVLEIFCYVLLFTCIGLFGISWFCFKQNEKKFDDSIQIHNNDKYNQDK